VPVDPKRSTGREEADWKIEKASLMDRTFHQVEEIFYVWKTELRLETLAASRQKQQGFWAIDMSFELGTESKHC
jgi:hypothetical protein